MNQNCLVFRIFYFFYILSFVFVMFYTSLLCLCGLKQGLRLKLCFVMLKYLVFYYYLVMFYLVVILVNFGIIFQISLKYAWYVCDNYYWFVEKN